MGVGVKTRHLHHYPLDQNLLIEARVNRKKKEQSKRNHLLHHPLSELGKHGRVARKFQLLKLLLPPLPLDHLFDDLLLIPEMGLPHVDNPHRYLLADLPHLRLLPSLKLKLSLNPWAPIIVILYCPHLYSVRLQI